MLHPEILTKEQRDLFFLLKKFSKEYGLVGGTAIALQLGHRRSIDFDLFTEKMFRGILLERKARHLIKIDKVLINKDSEFTFLTNSVKITFFSYPFSVEYSERLDDIIKMPDILTIAAMKAFALGRRAKWKDYVDLYFVLRDFYTLNDVVVKGKKIFGAEFNEKLFRTQLAYFEDIDFSEEIIYLPGFETSREDIRSALIKFSLEK